MQIVRTVLWILLFLGLLAFSIANWKPVEVTIWENLIVETKVPALVIVSFLLGMIPTWLFLRGTKWRLNRRIKTLENVARSSAMAQHAAQHGDGDLAAAPMVSDDRTAAPSVDTVTTDPTDARDPSDTSDPTVAPDTQTVTTRP